MNELLNFASGPLFRFSFAVLILGLIRLLYLTIRNGLEAKKKGQDKSIPVNYVRKLTFGYVFPIRAFRAKPIYAFVSILFHIGLLVTPILLFDHALLFDNSIGISWIALSLPKNIVDILTIMTIITGLILLFMRVSNQASRFISRKQDYLWIIILLVPFSTGLICAQLAVNPMTYQISMLLHILSGCLIFVLIPFTKIAHCILLPFGQWITARAWKFQSDGGELTTITLGKEGEQI
jgi:nitrate reductase gamma subunit